MGFLDKIKDVLTVDEAEKAERAAKEADEAKVEADKTIAEAKQEAAEAPLHLLTATSGAVQVRSESLPHPAKATILGPVQVIPQEFAGATSALLDLDPAMPAEALVTALLEDALAPPASGVAALRVAALLVVFVPVVWLASALFTLAL